MCGTTWAFLGWCIWSFAGFVADSAAKTEAIRKTWITRIQKNNPGMSWKQATAKLEANQRETDREQQERLAEQQEWVAAQMARQAAEKERERRAGPKVEWGADIHDTLEGGHLKTVVGMVQLAGYRCDTVSAARPLIFGRGFSLYCNNFAYEYSIKDRGGRWFVTVD